MPLKGKTYGKLKKIHFGKHPFIEKKSFFVLFTLVYIRLHLPTLVYTRLHSSRLIYIRLASSSDSSTPVYIRLHSSSDSSVFLEQILNYLFIHQ